MDERKAGRQFFPTKRKESCVPFAFKKPKGKNKQIGSAAHHEQAH
jgi:hypothetical protein